MEPSNHAAKPAHPFIRNPRHINSGGPFSGPEAHVCSFPFPSTPTVPSNHRPGVSGRWRWTGKNDSTDGWFHQPPDLQTVFYWNKVVMLENNQRKAPKTLHWLAKWDAFFATNPFYAWSSLKKNIKSLVSFCTSLQHQRCFFHLHSFGVLRKLGKSYRKKISAEIQALWPH